MKNLKYFLIIIISLIIFAPTVNATNATTIAELRSEELQALKNKKASNEAKKNQTKGEINSTS